MPYMTTVSFQLVHVVFLILLIVCTHMHCFRVVSRHSQPQLLPRLSILPLTLAALFSGRSPLKVTDSPRGPFPAADFWTTTSCTYDYTHCQALYVGCDAALFVVFVASTSLVLIAPALPLYTRS